MSKINYVFENRGDNVYNDVIFSGAPFLLRDFIYKIAIHSQFPYWRFGIRLSRTEQIEFFHPESRYKRPEFDKYVDINLAVGEWDGEVWSLGNRLQLTQYNIPGEDHVLDRFENYVEGSSINLFFEYRDKYSELHISYTKGKEEFSVNLVKINPEFKYFTFFAWADHIDFSLDTEIQFLEGPGNSEMKNNIQTIQVGNITFRKGDMFDTEAQTMTNVILLPASSTGTAQPNILIRASELGIPYPTKNEPGSLSLFNVFNQDLQAGYAYSVDGRESKMEIIRLLCDNILVKNKQIDGNSKMTCINIPLFGTGAGGLPAISVFNLYNEIFNAKIGECKIIVSVLSSKDFSAIVEVFNGRFTILDSPPIVEKPHEIKLLQIELNVNIEPSSFGLNKNRELIRLNLQGVGIKKNSVIGKFTNLESLYLVDCTIQDVHILAKIKKLKSLYLSSTIVPDNFSFLSSLPKLERLDLSGNAISSIAFLVNMLQIKFLYLKGNRISDISSLKDHSKIEVLDLSNNLIEDISVLATLSKLEYLTLAGNKISEIHCLTEIKRLRILDISQNMISWVSPVTNMPNLAHLKVDKNPFENLFEIKLAENDNHLITLQNVILREAELNQEDIELPAKVLLLGNHACGKSSLLSLIKNEPPVSMDSTHIVKIEKYCKKSIDQAIPDAIFYDFGGQDYYHGIYRAFLSSGSIYMILWNKITNKNDQRKDLNGLYTQDFSLEYWVSQKKYIEQEKYNGVTDPILLIQTYADLDQKYYFNDTHLKINIEGQFYISLGNEKELEHLSSNQRNKITHSLNYLKETINDFIDEKKLITKRPGWYINFIKYILSQSGLDDYRGKDVVRELLPHYRRPGLNTIALLKDDLDQLYRQGLVLYYKDIFPDRVWLNPNSLVKYIHETVLNKDKILVSHGTVEANIFEDVDPFILGLLIRQKVIFRHNYSVTGDPEYIIPNYLQLSVDPESGFELFTFGLGSPTFVLKFLTFIPFGLINQVICFFGQYPKAKKFWRDQLLFAFQEKAKVLIHIDFKLLEIRVYFSFIPNVTEQEKQSITKYIFFGILGLYWDMEIFDFDDFIRYENKVLKKENYLPDFPTYSNIQNYESLIQNPFCRPSDMLISLDDNHFVKYDDLWSSVENPMIKSYEINTDRSISERHKVLMVYPFQPFTEITLKRGRKIVISYSKQDLDYVDTFKKYLIPLVEDGLIGPPWYCTYLLAGSPWNEEIQRKFDEADIIFFIVSADLMATKYVQENEIKNAIDKWRRDNSVKIIPILLKPYHFSRASDYDLSKFTTLPYSLLPVTQFRNQDFAWHVISESIRIMIESSFDPGKLFDNPELIRSFELIMAEKKLPFTIKQLDRAERI